MRRAEHRIKPDAYSTCECLSTLIRWINWGERWCRCVVFLSSAKSSSRSVISRLVFWSRIPGDKNNFLRMLAGRRAWLKPKSKCYCIQQITENFPMTIKPELIFNFHRSSNPPRSENSSNGNQSASVEFISTQTAHDRECQMPRKKAPLEFMFAAWINFAIQQTFSAQPRSGEIVTRSLW